MLVLKMILYQKVSQMDGFVIQHQRLYIYGQTAWRSVASSRQTNPVIAWKYLQKDI